MAMRALYCHTVRMLLRQRDIVIWVLAFPLILASLFNVMFAHFDEYYRADPAPCAIVADENYHSDRAVFFREMLEEVSKSGDDQLLVVTEYPTIDEAQAAVLSGDAAAAIWLDDEALPSMSVSPLATDTLDQSIVRAVLDQYRQIYGEMKQSFLRGASSGAGAANAPVGADVAAPADAVTSEATPADAALAAPSDADIAAFAQSPEAASAAQSFMSDAVKTQQVEVLRSASSGTVRYYYALLGFASLMSITVSLVAVSATRANTAAVGARRQVSAMSPARQLLTAMAASFTVSFLALLVAFAFMRVVLGVKFGGREGLAVVALAVCALMATGLGAVLGAIPKMPQSGKLGLATGVTCFCSLFAGLYGEPAMQLSDHLSQSAPWALIVNPAAEAASAFYDLTYYDTLQPFFMTLGVLAVMALAFLVVAALLMRRQNYDRL